MITLFSLRRTARSLGLVSVGVLSTLGALSLAHIGPVSAQSPGVNLAQLVATISTLKNQQVNDEKIIASQGNTISNQGTTITSLQSSLSSVQSTQTTDEGNITVNTTNIGNLRTLTASFSLSSDPNAGGTNTLLTISGVNVQIVNGQGGTETTNSLGNLIVGYNEKDPDFTQNRSGSHNLVVGTGNNYLSYGGLIAGQNNLISATAPYASISGGQFNVARSGHASVSGGFDNVASGGSSSVSGGNQNTASADYASVSGGNSNTASGNSASVSGGQLNTASGTEALVSGGQRNTAIGDTASVSGGASNTARGLAASVSGGASNNASGSAASVSGGQSNTASSDNASVSGGGGLNQGTSLGWSAGSAYTGPGAEKTGNFHSP